ncbi:MAG: pyruvate, water dikinase regulatory protein [Bacillota bacterium]
MSLDKRTAIFVVSDSIGETAELVTRAAASQFDSGQMLIQRFPHIDKEEAVREVVRSAAAQTPSMIVFTLVYPDLRELLCREAAAVGVPAIDLLGPLMNHLSQLTGRSPRLQPGLVHQLDEEYYRRIEAVEFAVKYDDGKDARGLVKADVVVIGVSRTSKTPVCMYLAHKRVKAANVPLIPEIPPPRELFQLPPERVVGLTIDTYMLNQIRRERLKVLGLGDEADYANTQRIEAELRYAREVMNRIGCKVIDVSNKAIEETANQVLEIIRRRDLGGD